jgi:hypothetical protein
MSCAHSPRVVARLVPAIHAVRFMPSLRVDRRREGVDGRDKPGQDEADGAPQ